MKKEDITKYYQKYKLKKDLPDFAVGTIITWDYWTEEYTEYGSQIGSCSPVPKLRYKRDYVESKKEWFTPIGEAIDFYKPFPSFKEFFDYDDGHWDGEGARHNNMCNVCKTINKLEFEKELKELTYNLIKEKYGELINKTLLKGKD